MGIDLEFQDNIVAVENTDDVHNVVVCTLCSCYPRALLGNRLRGINRELIGPERL